MRDTLKIIVVLTFVCVICSFFLAFVGGITEEKIIQNAVNRVNKAITAVAPKAATIEEIKIGEDVAYRLLDNNKKVQGFAFLAVGQGYQGEIKILTVVDADFKKLIGIEVVDSLETPGLGAKIQESDFRGQFKNIGITEPIKCIKGEVSNDDEVVTTTGATVIRKNEISTITGATVSSRAVVNILNRRIKILRETLIKK